MVVGGCRCFQVVPCFNTYVEWYFPKKGGKFEN